MLVGVLVIGLLTAAVLHFGLQRQPRLNGTDGIFPSADIVTIEPGDTACEAVRVPAGTGALEVPISGDPGEGGLQARLVRTTPVRETVVTSNRDVRRGGWARFEFDRPTPNAPNTIACIDNLDAEPQVLLRGNQLSSGLTLNGREQPGGMTIQFVRPGRETLFATVPLVIERIGLIRELIGGWPRAVLILLVSFAGIGLSAALLQAACVAASRSPSRRRRAERVRVEPADTGLPGARRTRAHVLCPGPGGQALGAARGRVLELLPGPDRDADPQRGRVVELQSVRAHDLGQADRQGLRGAAVRGPATEPAQRRLLGPVADYPPLYYLTLVPAYSATHALGGSTLAAVTVMRGVSALYAGVTMLALFALLSELFPRRRRLVIAVAVICAYQPVFVWISGGSTRTGR